MAGSIAAAMVGSLYAAAEADRPVERVELRPEPAPVEPIAAMDVVEPAPLPAGVEIPEALAVAMENGELLDPETGLRLGPVTFVEREEEEVEPAPRPRRARRAPAPPVPRLHPDPGRHVVMVARQMNARGERIQGSCYHYIATVYERAGHDGWRKQRVVHNVGRSGPYADLGQIRTGDWLYIVNHPNRTPVGTHSVLFVSWQDRARGIANVIEHPGWGGATTGRERTYDVSRTYRITRPVLSR